jgi:hypothetical protein
MADLKSASGILSALGEHWFEAKRSRVLLDELTQTTITWLIEIQASGLTGSVQPDSEVQNVAAGGIRAAVSLADDGRNGVHQQTVEVQADPLASIFSFLDEANPAFDIDSIMQGFFSEHHPDVEFGQSFPVESQIIDDVAL